MDDARPLVVEAARRGDRDARAALLRELQDVWYRFCLGLLRDADAAREATQETAVRFLARLSEFRGDSRLKTWSLGIALNVVREMRRARRPEPTDPALLAAADPRNAADAPDGAVIVAEQARLLRAVLDDLPDRQREAVVLRFFEDLSVEETAKAMRCAQGTVKATVHQAMRALRERLNAVGL